jgi:hypothetical protein
VRLPGTPQDCGPLFELGWLKRQLQLGTPVFEGIETIPVERIIGTVHRGRDFDGCWHPLNARLAKIIADIEVAQPSALDEPIEVVRVDRAYFVADGHKRVALARRTGREFLDARINQVPTQFAVASEIEEQAIFRTARELEFRRHSGLEAAFPTVRFALTEIDGYGELFQAVQTHAFHLSEDADRIVSRGEVAEDWYTRDYLPTVANARAGIGSLIDSWTDADVYLAIQRQRIAWWGSECDATDCAAQELLVERQLAAARRRSLVGGLIRRDPADIPGASAARVLPLTDQPASDS